MRRRRSTIPPTGWGEAVKVEEGGTVQNRVADLDDAAESNEVLVIDFIPPKYFGVVAEVAEEPGELPQGFRRAIHTAGNSVSRERLWLKDGEAQEVIGFLGVPAILGPVHTHQEQAVGNIARRRLVSLVQALESSPHAAPSLAGM